VIYGKPSKPVTISSPNYPSSASNYNYNSNVNVNNVSATAIAMAPVYPIQYSVPTYPTQYTYPQPYCTINHALASGSGINAAYLSWSATNASSAYISNVGSVAVNGSQTVWPSMTTTYQMTVYGQNGQTANCSTTVYTNSAPYVSLTQIPYTGFDFGTVGNAMYWLGLAVLAVGGAYLMVYYLPRTMLGKAGIPTLALATNTKRYAPIVPAMAPVLAQKQAAHPIVAEMRTRGVQDTMAIVTSKDGSMPKIVIQRN
jgi:hypothetical protein